MVFFVRAFGKFSLVVALALVMGYLIPTDAGLAVAAESPGVLPPLDSPVPLVTAPRVPAGDFSQRAPSVVQEATGGGRAGREAVRQVPTGSAESSFDAATSVAVDRDMFSTVYLNADGTHTTELSLVPLNVRSDAGIWVPVSTEVLRSAAGAGWWIIR